MRNHLWGNHSNSSVRAHSPWPSDPGVQSLRPRDDRASQRRAVVLSQEAFIISTHSKRQILPIKYLQIKPEFMTIKIR